MGSSEGRLAAAVLYAGTAIVSLVLGAIYLFRPSFMPYHAVALGKGWSELDRATQTLLKALMEVAAGGWLALGVLVLLLVAFPIRRGERYLEHVHEPGFYFQSHLLKPESLLQVLGKLGIQTHISEAS